MYPIGNIWQNFGYGLLVKRKENYLYTQKCNNIKNNAEKENSEK